MSVTLLGNRYVSEILLMIHLRGHIMSNDMKEISTNHKYVTAAAQWLVDEGLVTVRDDPTHPRRKIWELTEFGTQIAELLDETTKAFKRGRHARKRPDIIGNPREDPVQTAGCTDMEH